MEKIDWMEEYLEEGLRLAADEGHESALRLLEKLLYEEFLTGCFYTFKESIQTSVEGMFDTNVRLSSKISLTINFINLIIGYLLVTNHNSLVKFFLKEGQPEQSESENRPDEK